MVRMFLSWALFIKHRCVCGWFLLVSPSAEQPFNRSSQGSKAGKEACDAASRALGLWHPGFLLLFFSPALCSLFSPSPLPESLLHDYTENKQKLLSIIIKG